MFTVLKLSSISWLVHSSAVQTGADHCNDRAYIQYVNEDIP